MRCVNAQSAWCSTLWVRPEHDGGVPAPGQARSAHAGGTIPFLVDRISLLAARSVPGTATRAPAGVEAYLRRLYYELAISTNPHAVASVLQLVGPERLLYGSDWPALDEADVQNLIQVLGGNPLLQPDDRARIERHNAMELFPRLRPGAAIH